MAMPGFTFVEFLLLIGLGGATFCYLLGLYSAFEFFGRRPEELAEEDLPAVTVLKPLKGEDVELYENLKTLCEQRAVRPQLLFGVADPADSAIGVVRRLQRDYPALDIELVVDPRTYGSNYKVSNLQNMLERAKHDVIVIADSDVRVGPHYLQRITAELAEPGVGLVTCLYRAVNRGRLPTLFESLFINTDFAALVILARKVERSTYAFGATIAMRREVLEEIGGFLPIANFLADDYQLGHRVAERGYRLALSREVVDTVISLGSWQRLIQHQLRWARTYRICRPGGYLGSLITHGTFWAVVNVVYHGFSPASVLASSLVVFARFVSAALFSERFLATGHPRDLLWLFPKDLFVSALWFAAFFGNTISWSGRYFRLLPSGEMVDISPGARKPRAVEAAPQPFAETRRTATGGR